MFADFIELNTNNRSILVNRALCTYVSKNMNNVKKYLYIHFLHPDEAVTLEFNTVEALNVVYTQLKYGIK